MAGLFITFEGGEGVGKTTQCGLLAEYLRQVGYGVVSTHEPGGSSIGLNIRRIILDPGQPLSETAELMLYMAERAQHVQEVIRPALLAGKVVISDRYTDASLAYQGCGRGLPIPMIEQLNLWATGGLAPDITYLLDMDTQAGICRVQHRCNDIKGGDRIEREPLQFHERVRQGYLETARKNSARFRVIDATMDSAQVQARIIEYLQAVLPR